MSIERVIVSFILVGLALCLALLLVPFTGTVSVFVVALVAGVGFFVKAIRDMRRPKRSGTVIEWPKPSTRRDERSVGTQPRRLHVVPRNTDERPPAQP